MNFGILAKVEQLEHDNEVMPMSLPEASRRFSAANWIARGDELDFGGIVLTVVGIQHKAFLPTDDQDRAAAVALCEPKQALADMEIEVLRSYGFES